MRVKNENLLLIDGVVQSGAIGNTTVNFRPVWLGHIAGFSIQMVYTGTPAGAFKLQGSNDVGDPTASGDAQKYNGVSNWTDITNSGTGAISAAGNFMYNVADANYNWVRLVWVGTGAGTTPVLTVARAYVKGI